MRGVMPTMHEKLKKVKTAIHPYVTKAQPVARVAMRVANIAIKLQKPTIMGALSMVTNGIDELAGQLNAHSDGQYGISAFAAHAQILEAVQRAGATCASYGNDEHKIIECRIPGMIFHIERAGSITTYGYPDEKFMEWLRQALDKVLAPAIDVRVKQQGQHDVTSYEAAALKLSTLDNAQADEILASSLPMLEGGRCILLDGKPGVGKTTLAQVIARKANLGRTVLLENKLVGYTIESSAPSFRSCGAGTTHDSLVMLSPGVIIVDDVDKVTMNLATIEALRSAAKLVILTANNGSYDEVLDGAMMRAGRVDEVFSIKPVDVPREAPFDRVSDDLWDEVREWPVAYLNELRKRLTHRPDDVRLDDLRARMLKKTRSGDKLL